MAGQTPKSVTAFANLKNLRDTWAINTVSVDRSVGKSPIGPRRSNRSHPDIGKKSSMPMRKIIGDLSNTERVLVGLDLRPATAAKGNVCVHRSQKVKNMFSVYTLPGQRPNPPGGRQYQRDMRNQPQESLRPRSDRYLPATGVSKRGTDHCRPNTGQTTAASVAKVYWRYV